MSTDVSVERRIERTRDEVAAYAMTPNAFARAS